MKIKTILAVGLFSVGTAAGLQAKSAIVTDIVDGDTIIVDKTTRVQLLGIDALGSSKEDFKAREMEWQSTSFTSNFLMGKKVRLEFDPANKIKKHMDRWERLLAYVYLEDGTFYNLTMIEQGYAAAYVKYPLEMEEKFVQAEKDARKENRGLWKLMEGERKEKGNVRKIYVARKGKKVYHEGSCIIVKSFPLEDRITFHEESEAKKLGYKRDRWCIPVLMKRFWGE